MLTRISKAVAAAVAAGAMCGALGAAQATPAAKAGPAAKHGASCFASSNWNGWTAATGGDRLYLRVGVKDIYQVELSPGSHARKMPGEFLVNQVRGTSWICSPLDLDLAIADDHGFRRPLIATGLRKLTPAEVAAIPRRELP
jgi:hypothetical protein